MQRRAAFKSTVAATTCRSLDTATRVLRTGRRRSGGPASPRPAGRARRSLTRSFARASRSCSILAAWSCCRRAPAPLVTLPHLCVSRPPLLATLQSQQRHLAAELAAAACRVKGTGSFDHFVIRGGTHDLPVLGLPLIQNTAFCAANQPRDSPVCEAWFRALKWLADDLGWDASGMSALEDWAPTSPASPGVRARAEGSCSKWSTDWEDY